jgi:hypothetical protein
VHQCKPVADADTMAEAVNGVFEDTTGGIMVVNLISIAAAKEIELSKAFLDLLRQVGEKDPDWRTGYPRIPVCGIQAGSTDTMAEAVNGVFEDTADGIVALSSISIAAAKEMELSFKLSAAAGSTATPVHQCKPAAGADTTAEAVNGVFEDTADGIVVWSSTPKKRWKSLKHSRTFYAQQPRRIQNCKRQETLF